MTDDQITEEMIQMIIDRHGCAKAGELFMRLFLDMAATMGADEAKAFLAKVDRILGTTLH